MGLAERGRDALDDILARAAERAQRRNAGYAGDLTPHETAALLHAGAVTLVDVRTEPEWLQIGRIPGTRRIEWSAPGASRPNERFVDELARTADGQRPIALICRSGVRSERAARAAAQAGLAPVYNVLEGFEGDPGPDGRRGVVNGWQYAGLPWAQEP